MTDTDRGRECPTCKKWAPPYECRVCRGRYCRHFASAMNGTLCHCVGCARKPTATQIAIAFCHQLQDWISDHLPEVVRRNGDETNDGICHTHDFCDANMAMDAAFERVRGRSAVPSSEPDASLWDRAWRKAAAAEFDPAKIREGK